MCRVLLVLDHAGGEAGVGDWLEAALPAESLVVEHRARQFGARSTRLRLLRMLSEHSDAGLRALVIRQVQSLTPSSLSRLARFLEPARLRADLQVVTLVMPAGPEQRRCLLERAEARLDPDLIIRVTGIPKAADHGPAAA